jgi:hypothetical protein
VIRAVVHLADNLAQRTQVDDSRIGRQRRLVALQGGRPDLPAQQSVDHPERQQDDDEIDCDDPDE